MIVNINNEKKKELNIKRGIAQLVRALPSGKPNDDLATGIRGRGCKKYQEVQLVGFESCSPDKVMIGSSNIKKFRNFQIRWKEKLGYQEDPYLIRWTFVIFGFSIRIHHWIKSDDRRFFHDHSADLLSIVLKGRYWNVKPVEGKRQGETVSIDIGDYAWTYDTGKESPFYVEGIFNSWRNFFHPSQSIWFSKAEDRHYLCIPKGGAWTLMFEGRPRHKWGFYVNSHKWRPLRYFHKYGIIQTSDYQ